MFKLFKKLTKSKNPKSKSYRKDMAARLDGRPIRYVTERREDIDVVIGRQGSLAIKEDTFIVFASGEIMLRAKIEELDAWELLSKEGVVLTAPDMERGGETRTIIAYYVYYRK